MLYILRKETGVKIYYLAFNDELFIYLRKSYEKKITLKFLFGGKWMYEEKHFSLKLSVKALIKNNFSLRNNCFIYDTYFIKKINNVYFVDLQNC